MRECKKLHVKFIKDKVTDIIYEDSEIKGVECVKGIYFADTVILATGGLSYPATGSTGDGYLFAEKLGHTVTELSPSLVPIVCDESFVCELTKLSLKNVTLSLYDAKKKSPLFSEIGEISFMPYGVAGPLSLSASCLMSPKLLE